MMEKKNKSEVNRDSFFREYQKAGLLALIQQSIKKVLVNWLSDREHSGERMELLEDLLKNGVENCEQEKLRKLPTYIQRIWSDPHAVISELANIPVEEIRNLVEITIREEYCNPLLELKNT